MKTIEITVKVTITPTTLDSSFEISDEFAFTTGNDFDDFLRESQEALIDQLVENFGEEQEDKIRGGAFDVEHEVTRWGDVEYYPTLQDIDLLNDIAENVDDYQDFDVIESAVELDIQMCDIDEAYSGSYKDDEDFAWEMANDLGLIDKNAGWPNNCIDWERAARDLMYDHSEANGHYFRNM